MMNINSHIHKKHKVRQYLTGIILLIFVLLLLSCDHKNKTDFKAKNYQRIISTAPSITEVIHFLNADKRLIAVSDYCTFPKSTLNLPKIGGLLDPNLERVVRLKPDLIIILPSAKNEFDKLSATGVDILEIKNETISDILKSITRIGKTLDEVPRSSKLVDSLRIIDTPLKGYPLLKAMIIISRQKGALKDIYVAGGKSYLSHFLTNAGFTNCYEGISCYYSQISTESIIRERPDVIIETEMNNDEKIELQTDLSDWKHLTSIPAVRNHRVFKIESSFIHLPAIRVFKLQGTLKELRKKLQ